MTPQPDTGKINQNQNGIDRSITKSRMKPLVSVIMPVYNAGKVIQQALASIADQTFCNYELLLLDSFSTDSSVSTMKAAAANDSRIILHSEKDNGIYHAMNKGIELAKGEWLYFMGSDDMFFDKNVLSNVATHLTRESDLVYGDVIWMPAEAREEGRCEPENLMHCNINHQRIFYRKALFLKWGSYDLQYRVAADHELNIRLFCNNQVKKWYVPVSIARYSAGGFSAGKVDEVFWNNWKSIFKNNFAIHLHKKELYKKQGWYCRYQIDKQNYKKAFLLFCDVFLHTLSPGFVLLTLRQLFHKKRKHAG